VVENQYTNNHRRGNWRGENCFPLTPEGGTGGEKIGRKTAFGLIKNPAFLGKKDGVCT